MTFIMLYPHYFGILPSMIPRGFCRLDPMGDIDEAEEATSAMVVG